MLGRMPALARHMPRIVMPLSRMIDSYVDTTKLGRNWKLLEFFEFVKSTFPDQEYMAIQKDHLSFKNLDFIHRSQFLSSELKYLDFPFWAHSKYSVGKKLISEEHAGAGLLDIGSGPGHFGSSPAPSAAVRRARRRASAVDAAHQAPSLRRSLRVLRRRADDESGAAFRAVARGAALSAGDVPDGEFLLLRHQGNPPEAVGLAGMGVSAEQSGQRGGDARLFKCISRSAATISRPRWWR